MTNSIWVLNVLIFQGLDWHHETQLPDWARDDYVYPEPQEKETAHAHDHWGRFQMRRKSSLVESSRCKPISLVIPLMHTGTQVYFRRVNSSQEYGSHLVCYVVQSDPPGWKRALIAFHMAQWVRWQAPTYTAICQKYSRGALLQTNGSVCRPSSLTLIAAMPILPKNAVAPSWVPPRSSVDRRISSSFLWLGSQLMAPWEVLYYRMWWLVRKVHCPYCTYCLH